MGVKSKGNSNEQRDIKETYLLFSTPPNLVTFCLVCNGILESTII